MKLIQWVARGFDLSLLLLVVALMIGEGVPSLSKSSTPELIGHFAFLLMLVGLLTAWKWEGVGGSLVLAGFCLFWANDYSATGNLRIGWVFVMFAVTGLLFAIHWWQSREKSIAPGSNKPLPRL